MKLTEENSKVLVCPVCKKEWWGFDGHGLTYCCPPVPLEELQQIEEEGE